MAHFAILQCEDLFARSHEFDVSGFRKLAMAGNTRINNVPKRRDGTNCSEGEAYRQVNLTSDLSPLYRLLNNSSIRYRMKSNDQIYVITLINCSFNPLPSLF